MTTTTTGLPEMWAMVTSSSCREFCTPTTFFRVTLPLSLPGVIAGFFMVFIPTVGEYVTPLLVGGSRGSLYGNIIQDFFTKAANWPFGSAMSMVMLVMTLALVAMAVRVVDLRKLVE